MMKVVYSLVLITMLVAACSSQVADPISTPIQQVQQVETAAPTSPPTQTEQATFTEVPPTLPPTQAPAGPASDGSITYRIIPGESQVTYEVGEVFIDQNNRFNVAQGITPQVDGEIIVDFANPAASSIGPIEVDISQFTSDSSRRDNAIRERFLESARYPIARFVPKDTVGLPDSYTEGESVSFQANGDLTIREVTRPATFDVTVVAGQDALQGEASTTILMSDFGFGPISIGGILNTEDEVKVNIQFVARPGE